MKNIRVIGLFLFASFSNVEASDVEFEKQLIEICKNTFEHIKSKDIESIVANMPPLPDEATKQRLVAMVDRRYEFWYRKYGKIKSMNVDKVLSSEPGSENKSDLNAVEEVNVRMKVELEKITAYKSCRFVRNDTGWHLYRLP